MESTVRFFFKPEAENPILIGGLPGVGQVGKLASDFLISRLSAQKFAEQLSPHFPHYTILEKNGLLRPPTHSFYWTKIRGKDYFILTGDCPITTSEGHYEVASKILEAMEAQGVGEIYMLGGFIPSTPWKGKSRVVVIPNQPKLQISKNSKLQVGPIVGLTGLLVSLAGIRGMKGACLLAEAGNPVLDSQSAKLVLETLSELLSLKLDLSTLDQQARAMEEWVERMRKEIERRETPRPEETWYIG